MLQNCKNVCKVLQNYHGGVIFQKCDPPEAAPLVAPCLETAIKKQKVVQHVQGDVIFQKCDPPEAAPLLAPSLEIAKQFGKMFNIFMEVTFFKNMTRRRQHPC